MLPESMKRWIQSHPELGSDCIFLYISKTKHCPDTVRYVVEVFHILCLSLTSDTFLEREHIQRHFSILPDFNQDIAKTLAEVVHRRPSNTAIRAGTGNRILYSEVYLYIRVSGTEYADPVALCREPHFD